MFDNMETNKQACNKHIYIVSKTKEEMYEYEISELRRFKKSKTYNSYDT